MTMLLPARIFSLAGNRRCRQTALALTFVASCVVAPAPISLSFAEARLASPAAQPLDVPPPKIEGDGRREPFTAVTVPATIQSFFVTDLYAKDSGYVSQVYNDIGDHVKQGQVLAVIEDPELQAQYNKAQAAVQQLRPTSRSRSGSSPPCRPISHFSR